MSNPYDDYEEEDLDSLIEECGYDEEEDTCTMAGTEHCGFFCPFHQLYFPNMEESEDENSEG